MIWVFYTKGAEMKAVLKIDIQDWTSKELGLGPIPKGTRVFVSRVEDRTMGVMADYIAKVKLNGLEYSFEINGSEFEVTN